MGNLAAYFTQFFSLFADAMEPIMALSDDDVEKSGSQCSISFISATHVPQRGPSHLLRPSSPRRWRLGCCHLTTLSIDGFQPPDWRLSVRKRALAGGKAICPQGQSASTIWMRLCWREHGSWVPATLGKCSDMWRFESQVGCLASFATIVFQPLNVCQVSIVFVISR